MRAGALRKRITIVDPTTVQDPVTGQPMEGPGDVVLTTWASIRSASSKEIYVLGAGFAGEVTHAIRVRSTDTRPRAGMNVQFQDREFRIQAVSDPDERGRELDLMCLEILK